MRAARAILCACLLAGCVTGAKPREVPPPVSIVDEPSRVLAHKAELDRIEEARVKARNDEELRASHVRATITGWGFVLGGLLLVGAGIVAIFVPALRGKCIALALLGLCVWSAAAAVESYGKTLALIGIITLAGTLLCLVVAGAYLAWGWFVANRALRQTVATVQEAKKIMPPETADKVFGAGGIADTVQDARTRRVVHSIKSRFKEQKP